MLESEETGFSAIEEEVKSRDVNARPTVYAGKVSKDYKSYGIDMNHFAAAEDEFNDPILMNQFLDNTMGSNQNLTNNLMIDKFYHSSMRN